MNLGTTQHAAVRESRHHRDGVVVFQRYPADLPQLVSAASFPSGGLAAVLLAFANIESSGVKIRAHGGVEIRAQSQPCGIGRIGVVTAGDTQRASAGIDDSRRPDPGEHLSGANLTDVVYDSQTRWPNSFTPP
ncbi:hypothetical protein AB0M34_02040 [Nocardia sp. NPDC050193]